MKTNDEEINVINRSNKLATEIENLVFEEHKKNIYSVDEIFLALSEASRRLSTFALKQNIKNRPHNE